MITVVIYIKIASDLRTKENYSVYDENKNKFIKRIVVYPIIMIASFLPITCVRIQMIITHEFNFIFMIFAYFCYGIYGFANSIAYSYNDTVINSIKESLIHKAINNSELSSQEL